LLAAAEEEGRGGVRRWTIVVMTPKTLNWKRKGFLWWGKNNFVEVRWNKIKLNEWMHG